MKPICLECHYSNAHFLLGHVFFIKLTGTYALNQFHNSNLVCGHPLLQCPFSHAQLSPGTVHILFYYNLSIQSTNLKKLVCHPASAIQTWSLTGAIL